MRTQTTKGPGAVSSHRQWLFTELERYVKHREYCFNHAASKRSDIMAAISLLKRALDFYRYEPIDSWCQIILKYEREMRLLIPGVNSRNYEGAQKRVNALVKFSKEYLQID